MPFPHSIAGVRQKLRGQLRRMRALAQPRFLRRANCDGVVLDLATSPYMGFGATIAWLHMVHVAGDALGAPVAVTNPARWPFGGARADCALDRFIRIPAANTGANRVFHLDLGNKDNLRRWGYQDSLEWRHCLFGYRPHGASSLESYRREVLARAYVPTDFARTRIAQKLGFLPDHYIAWHIRRGDKTTGPAKEDDAVDVARYVDATRRLIGQDRQAAPKRIVVCTDSEAALREAIDAASSVAPGVEVVFDPAEKRWDGYCALHRAGEIQDAQQMVDEVLNAQSIIDTLRRAEYLVGCNSSYLFRVAAMLQDRDPRCVSLSENKTFRQYFPL